MEPLNVLLLLWQRKWLLILTLFGGAMAGTLACLCLTPDYEATTLISAGRGTRAKAEVLEKEDDKIASITVLIKSDDVLRIAIKKIGAETLLVPSVAYTDGQTVSEPANLQDQHYLLQTAHAPYANVVIQTLASWKLKFLDFTQIRSATVSRSDYTNTENRALLLVRSSLAVKVEPQTDVVRISFRHSNPQVAASFANSLVQAVVAKQIEIIGLSDPEVFFESQKMKFAADLRIAAIKLSTFGSKDGLYMIDEQKRLALSRLSTLMTASANTRGAIAEKESTIISVSKQLAQMRPISTSPAVSAIVSDLTQVDNSRAVRPSTDLQIARDPPLLLVRAYQDLVQNLLRLNADLAGLRSLLIQQETELKHAKSELDQISSNEGKFALLEQDFNVARINAEMSAKRAAAEKVDAEFVRQKLATVKTFQAATVPFEKAFPKASLIIPLSAGATLLLCCAIIVFSHREKPKADDIRPVSSERLERVRFFGTSRVLAEEAPTSKAANAHG